MNAARGSPHPRREDRTRLPKCRGLLTDDADIQRRRQRPPPHLSFHLQSIVLPLSGLCRAHRPQRAVARGENFLELKSRQIKLKIPPHQAPPPPPLPGGLFVGEMQFRIRFRFSLSLMTCFRCYCFLDMFFLPGGDKYVDV